MNMEYNTSAGTVSRKYASLLKEVPEPHGGRSYWFGSTVSKPG